MVTIKDYFWMPYPLNLYNTILAMKAGKNHVAVTSMSHAQKARLKEVLFTVVKKKKYLAVFDMYFGKHNNIYKIATILELTPAAVSASLNKFLKQIIQYDISAYIDDDELVAQMLAGDALI